MLLICCYKKLILILSSSRSDLSKASIVMIISFCQIRKMLLKKYQQRPISQYRTAFLQSFHVIGLVQCYVNAGCVCARECVGHTAVLGGQVFSCFCFLGADTGVNIQKMMSQPQQQARQPYKAKLSFHRDLSNIKTVGCPTCVWQGVSWYTLHLGHQQINSHATQQVWQN